MVPDNISIFALCGHCLMQCYADITQQVLSTPGSGNNWIIVCQHSDTGRYKNKMFVCPCVSIMSH